MEKVRGETKAVQESMERAREVLEDLGKGGGDAEHFQQGSSKEVQRDKKRRREDVDRRVWEVFEKEFSE